MLAVTGIGMVSSLGLDVVTGCAAARGGLLRAQELDVQVIDRETQDLETVVGHVVPANPGFTGVARLLRLGQLALVDLDRSTAWRTITPTRLSTWMVLPEADSAWKPLRASEDDDPPYRNSRQSQPVPYPDASVLVQTLGKAINYAFNPALTQIIASSRTGFVEVLGPVSETLASGKTEAALVLLVDSLIEPAMVQHLFDGRLKCGDNPVGLQPGEAAVAVLLRSTKTAEQTNSPPLANISGYTTAEDEQHDYSQKPALGRGLSAVVEAVLGKIPSGGDVRWIFSDLNGEARRAEDFGQALVRLIPKHPSLQNFVGTYPATSFGDTRVAGPGLALAMVSRAFTRGYAHDPHAIVLSSSGDGRRSALAIEQAETREV